MSAVFFFFIRALLVILLDQLLHILLALLLSGLLIKHTSLDDFVVQVFLTDGPVQDAFFDHRPRD